ncbi:MAG: hypothetical protein C4326_03420 [Ignavibacteria bacterium]
MKLHRRTILVFVIFGVMGTIRTTQAQVLRLTLEEAVRVALQKNHALAEARHEVGRADARVREAWGYALPSIDIAGRYTRAIKRPVFFFPNIFDSTAFRRGDVRAIEIGSANSIDLNVTVSQVLFNSAVFTGVGSARIYSQATREVYRAKLIETITAARKAYYAVLLAAEVREMMRANMRNAEENVRNATILAAQGLISEYDKLRAEVGLANLRPEAIRAENNYDLALNSLKVTLGLAVNDSVEITGTLTYEPVDEGVLRSGAESVLEANPSLGALRYQLEVNDAITRVERSNFLPSLAAFGTYQFQTQQNDLRISTHDFVRSSLAGVTLSLNLFDGFRTTARVEQAALDARKTQEQIAYTEQSLKAAVQATVMSLRRAKERIDAQERTVEQAERGYRIAVTRFTTGSGTQLEVNDAQLALTTARTNRVQAMYDYLVAAADLDQLLGRKPSYVQSAAEE